MTARTTEAKIRATIESRKPRRFPRGLATEAHSDIGAAPTGLVVPLDTRRNGPRIADASRRDAAARVVISLGPATVVAGLVWALLQPYRVTLFEPQGQSFWWLAVEPPLLVVLVGVVFHLVVARGLVRDLLDAEPRHGSDP